MKKIKNQLQESQESAAQKMNETAEYLQGQAEKISANAAESFEEISDRTEEVIDQLEDEYEDSWLQRHKGLFFFGAVFTAVSATFAYFLARKRDLFISPA